jgi:hypothetical protein
MLYTEALLKWTYKSNLRLRNICLSLKLYKYLWLLVRLTGKDFTLWFSGLWSSRSWVLLQQEVQRERARIQLQCDEHDHNLATC